MNEKFKIKSLVDLLIQPGGSLSIIQIHCNVESGEYESLEIGKHEGSASYTKTEKKKEEKNEGSLNLIRKVLNVLTRIY